MAVIRNHSRVMFQDQSKAISCIQWLLSVPYTQRNLFWSYINQTKIRLYSFWNNNIYKLWYWPFLCQCSHMVTWFTINQTEIRLYFTFSGWIGTKRNSVWFLINQKIQIFIETLWQNLQKYCNAYVTREKNLDV